MEQLNYRSRSGVGEQDYKSRGEVQIGRFLDRNSIAYNYEHPLAVVDRGKTRIWYPDFQLPEYSMIIEYFGVNGKQAYDEQARHKIAAYRQSGIDGIFLTKASFRGDWPGRILGQIENILQMRLEEFRSQREKTGKTF